MTIEQARTTFERWYAEEYSWEIGRGRGRLSRTLTMYEGKYTSDLTANDFKVWCAALGIKGENK